VEEDEILREAVASGQGEAYRVLWRRGGVQVGVGAKSGRKEAAFFVEVTVQLCPGDGGLDLAALDGSVKLLNLLRSMGYSISCRDGLVDCELPVKAGGLKKEAGIMVRRISSSAGRRVPRSGRGRPPSINGP